jgi:hypothetical protein
MIPQGSEYFNYTRCELLKDFLQSIMPQQTDELFNDLEF